MNRLRELYQVFRDAVREWSSDNSTRLAAALAFYSILSIAPLFILAVAIAGMVFGEEAARGELLNQMRGLVGDAGADVAQAALANAKKPEAGALATFVGLVTLLVGASGVFGELHNAMNSVWNVRAKPGKGFWSLIRDKFLSFGMVLSVGFLLLVSLFVSAALSSVSDYMSAVMFGAPLLIGALNFIVSFFVIAGLFALIFRYLPDVRMPWSDLWFGACTTSLLFTAGKAAIGIYLARAAVGSPFGAAGSLVAMVVWIYYSALIVFFGAELTQVHAKKMGSKVEPTSRAEWIPKAEAHVPAGGS